MKPEENSPLTDEEIDLLETELDSLDDLDIDLDDIDLEDLEEEDDESLKEFKASMGDPSTTAEPTKAAGGAVKKRSKADLKKKGHDEHVPATTGMKPKNKATVMSEVVKEMMRMDEQELINAYANLIDGDENAEVDSVDYSADIDAIFEGNELSEELRDKAKTIFESAVNAKVADVMEEHIHQTEAVIAEQVEAIEEALIGKVNDYLDYVVEEWMEENKLAVDSGIKVAMSESFIQGMKELFDEHHVSIPENEVEIVEDFAERIKDLEEELSETVEKNIEMSKAIRQYEYDHIFHEMTSDLTESQSDKLQKLIEGVEVSGAEDFEKKLTLLKGRYFKESASPSSEINEDDLDSPVELNEDTTTSLDPSMRAYLASISRTVKK